MSSKIEVFPEGMEIEKAVSAVWACLLLQLLQQTGPQVPNRIAFFAFGILFEIGFELLEGPVVLLLLPVDVGQHEPRRGCPIEFERPDEEVFSFVELLQLVQRVPQVVERGGRAPLESHGLAQNHQSRLEVAPVRATGSRC